MPQSQPNTYIPNPWPFNSPSHRAAYMCQWTGSALVQIMTCCLFSAKPLPKPMAVYCQFDPWEQNSVKFKSFMEMHLKTSSVKWQPFYPGGDELMAVPRLTGSKFVWAFKRTPNSFWKPVKFYDPPKKSLYFLINWTHYSWCYRCSCSNYNITVQTDLGDIFYKCIYIRAITHGAIIEMVI